MPVMIAPYVHSLSFTNLSKNQTTNNSKPIAALQHGKITDSDSGSILNPLLCPVLKMVDLRFHPDIHGKPISILLSA